MLTKHPSEEYEKLSSYSNSQGDFTMANLEQRSQKIADVLDHEQGYNSRPNAVRLHDEVEEILQGLSRSDRLSVLTSSADLEKAGMGFDLQILDHAGNSFEIGKDKKPTPDGGVELTLPNDPVAANAFGFLLGGHAKSTVWLSEDGHKKRYEMGGALGDLGHERSENNGVTRSHHWGTGVYNTADANFDEVRDSTQFPAHTVRRYQDGRIEEK